MNKSLVESSKSLAETDVKYHSNHPDPIEYNILNESRASCRGKNVQIFFISICYLQTTPGWFVCCIRKMCVTCFTLMFGLCLFYLMYFIIVISKWLFLQISVDC